MPNIFHQSVEDILKAATPEQKLLWNYIFLRFGERISVSQFYFQGPVAALGELIVYSANKLYLAYEFDAGESQGTGLASIPTITFFNEANVASRNYCPVGLTYDGTAAALRYYPTSYRDQNFYFSRITNSFFDYVKFIGYRIGI